jgi:hypothetical protein
LLWSAFSATRTLRRKNWRLFQNSMWQMTKVRPGLMSDRCYCIHGV